MNISYPDGFLKNETKSTIYSKDVLEKKFSGPYDESLVNELEGNLDLVAKYIKPSRINNWLFLYNGRYRTRRMQYFFDSFKNFENICGKGKLEKDFALKLLTCISNDYWKIVLNYPDSFEFYKNEPSEEIEPQLAEILGLKSRTPRNSPEKFKYNNYGKIQDLDIVTKLISLCNNSEDLKKIKELSVIVRKVLEGASKEDIKQDSYIEFLNGLVNIGYATDYTSDAAEKYVKDYYNFFDAVEEGIINKFLINISYYRNILNSFEKFNQNMLAAIVSSPYGREYIMQEYNSNDGKNKFDGLNFWQAILDSIERHGFESQLEISGEKINKEFNFDFLGLGTNDEKVEFILKCIEIKKKIGYIGYIKNNGYLLEREILLLIKYFGLESNNKIIEAFPQIKESRS